MAFQTAFLRFYRRAHKQRWSARRFSISDKFGFGGIFAKHTHDVGLPIYRSIARIGWVESSFFVSVIGMGLSKVVERFVAAKKGIDCG